MTNGNDPSMPCAVDFASDEQKKNYHVENKEFHYYGLTKREFFAAMAMQGLLAAWGQHDVTSVVDFANDAVLSADALITELNRKKS